jgi:hypothetical protein
MVAHNRQDPRLFDDFVKQKIDGETHRSENIVAHNRKDHRFLVALFVIFGLVMTT